LDSTRLDSLYKDCAVKLSASYRKTVFSLKEGKTTAASREFKTFFAPEVKKLYTETAETAPKIYIDDCNWNEKIKILYITTQKTAVFLEKRDVKNSKAGLESLREFFYKLHTDNKINIASDAIYAFRKELNEFPPGKTLTKKQTAILSSLKSKIFQAAPSEAMKKDKGKFNAEANAWSDAAGRILSRKKIDAPQIKLLRDSTEKFYFNYGMDFE